MGVRASPPYRTSRRTPARFTFAWCASLLVHLWLAWELPAGAPRAGGGAARLTVRLEPPVSIAPAPTVLDDAKEGTPRIARSPGPQPGPRRSLRDTGARGPVRARAGANSAGVAAHTDPTYYPARQLDVYPALLAPLSIRYPERALAEHRAGRALVMLLIDAAGKVDDVAVVEAQPPGYFEEAARETFAAAAFSAARRNGLAVKSRVLIQLTFDPAAGAAEAQ